MIVNNFIKVIQIKLFEIYQSWKRNQDFSTLEEIRKSISSYKDEVVKKDIEQALNQIKPFV